MSKFCKKTTDYVPCIASMITDLNGDVFVPLLTSLEAGWYIRPIKRNRRRTRMVVRFGIDGLGSYRAVIVQWIKGRIAISATYTKLIDSRESLVVPPEVLRYMLKK